MPLFGPYLWAPTLNDKDTLIEWLMEEGLLTKSQKCSVCKGDVQLVKFNDQLDGVK